MMLKSGRVLYSCWPYTNDDGRVEITIDEWVIRSIRCKRNSQTQYGEPKLFPVDTQYVNLTMKVEGLSMHKGVWKKSIPRICRRQFVYGNRLPTDIFTTPLQALKFALTMAGSPAEVRAVKSRITRLRKSKAA